MVVKCKWKDLGQSTEKSLKSRDKIKGNLKYQLNTVIRKVADF